jgi:hypothetical protein
MGTSAFLVPISGYVRAHPNTSAWPDSPSGPRNPSGGALLVPALQAGGQGFDPVWLHSTGPLLRSGRIGLILAIVVGVALIARGVGALIS